MNDQEKPIAWRALEPGTRVYSSDGEQVGKVSNVIADDSKDIFSGIAFHKGMLGESLFAPAAVVESITTEGVHLTLSLEDAGRLKPFGR